MPRVDFYVLEQADLTLIRRVACRLVAKAYDGGLRIFVRVASPEEAGAMDELLWTFQDRGFIPHEIAAPAGASHPRVTVLLGAGSAPATHRDLLVNLSGTVPENFEEFERIAEIVDADASRRHAGRDRFRQYRESGCMLETHNL